eukprot:763056-Hanusia_phi.AAC.14
MFRILALSCCFVCLTFVPQVSPYAVTTRSQTLGSESSRAGACINEEGNRNLVCTTDGFADYIAVHHEQRRLQKGSPRQRRARRFLACKPMGGIGNYISGLMSCLAMAMVTNRSLLLAKPPPTPPEKTTLYDVPVAEMFDFPLDMSLDLFGPVDDIPFLVDQEGNARDTEDLQMVDIRSHDLLCSNFTTSYDRPILVMPAHLWLSAITMNKVHSSWFSERFGVDRHGVIPFVQKVGPSFIRPRREIQDLIDELWRFLTNNITLNNVVGLQARVGMDIDIKAYNDRPPADSAPEFVRCAYSYMSQPCKEAPSVWIIAADQMKSKREIVMQVALNEGPVVAAANEEGLRKTLGLPSDFFAHDGKLSPPVGSIKQLPCSVSLLQLGFALIEFASGARALVLASASPMNTLSSMRAAVIEMFILKYADILVVTENSTFWIPAVAFVRRRPWGPVEEELLCEQGDRKCCDAGVYVMTTTKRFALFLVPPTHLSLRCYPLPSFEPTSDAGYRSRVLTRSRCYTDSSLDPSTTWLPPS